MLLDHYWISKYKGGDQRPLLQPSLLPYQQNLQGHLYVVVLFLFLLPSVCWQTSYVDSNNTVVVTTCSSQYDVSEPQTSLPEKEEGSSSPQMLSHV